MKESENINKYFDLFRGLKKLWSMKVTVTSLVVCAVETVPQVFEACPRRVMVKAMDFRIVVSEFELRSSYYTHFQTNTRRTGMNPLILPAMG